MVMVGKAGFKMTTDAGDFGRGFRQKRTTSRHIEGRDYYIFNAIRKP